MIEYIGGGADYLGINNLDKIKCPDCNRAYLHKSKFNPTILICDECALKISENDLKKEAKFLPTFGQMSKPFINQVAANRILPDDGSEGRAFVAAETDDDKISSFSLEGLAKKQTGGLPINTSGKAVTEKTIDAIKPLLGKLQGSGKEIKKVDLK